jgi:hypothetical protein
MKNSFYTFFVAVFFLTFYVIRSEASTLYIKNGISSTGDYTPSSTTMKVRTKHSSEGFLANVKNFRIRAISGRSLIDKIKGQSTDHKDQALKIKAYLDKNNLILPKAYIPLPETGVSHTSEIWNKWDRHDNVFLFILTADYTSIDPREMESTGRIYVGYWMITVTGESAKRDLSRIVLSTGSFSGHQSALSFKLEDYDGNLLGYVSGTSQEQDTSDIYVEYECLCD